MMAVAAPKASLVVVLLLLCSSPATATSSPDDDPDDASASPSCDASSSSTSSPTEQQDRIAAATALLAHLSSTGAAHVPLDIKLTSYGGLGVYVGRDVSAGETIFALPSHSMLHVPKGAQAMLPLKRLIRGTADEATHVRALIDARAPLLPALQAHL